MSLPLLATYPTHVFIFTDSLFASNAVVSSKAAVAHSATIRALRQLFSSVLKLVPVTFHWIRGHSGAGGNERVDRIAKKYATLSVGLPAVPAPTSFVGHRSSTPWPFSVSGAPLHLFLDNLPKAVSTFRSCPAPPSVVTLREPERLPTRAHSMRLRERPLRIVTSVPPAALECPVVPVSPATRRLSPIAKLFGRLRIRPVPASVTPPSLPRSGSCARAPCPLDDSGSDSDLVDCKHS